MSVLKRFRDIMASNVNAALDKLEDPSKMIDQLLRDLNNDLGQVRAETAGIMADEARAKRALDEAVAEVSKLQSYAEKAVSAGNDDDARLFLEKKAAATQKQTSLATAYEAAKDSAEKMRQMHDKLSSQIDELNSRREAIKAKVSVANVQDRINKMEKNVSSGAASISAFDRMEQKADRLLDEANAMAELNSAKSSDKLNEAMKRYAPEKESVEDELAALKAKLNK